MKKLTLANRLTLILVVLCWLIGCAWFRTPEQQWQVDLEEYNTGALSRHYFGYFLAIQSLSIYDLADPPLHMKIDKWIEKNEPIFCPEQPESTGSGNSVTVYCKCTITIDNMITRFSASKQYFVIEDFETITLTHCIES